MDPSTNFMHYVYVLRNLNSEQLYFGYTNDLERRIKEHSKNNLFKLIYYEAYVAERDAKSREKKLKHYGQSRTHLKSRIVNSLIA